MRFAFGAGRGPACAERSRAAQAAIQSSSSASLMEPTGFASVIPLWIFMRARCDCASTRDAIDHMIAPPDAAAVRGATFRHTRVLAQLVVRSCKSPPALWLSSAQCLPERIAYRDWHLRIRARHLGHDLYRQARSAWMGVGRCGPNHLGLRNRDLRHLAESLALAADPTLALLARHTHCGTHGWRLQVGASLGSADGLACGARVREHGCADCNLAPAKERQVVRR